LTIVINSFIVSIQNKTAARHCGKANRAYKQLKHRS
jgi:hypothetical protein